MFDKILIEVTAKPAIYAVRDRPVINDATVEDAMKSGLDEMAKVISSGCDAPGVILNRCSEAFLDGFNPIRVNSPPLAAIELHETFGLDTPLLAAG